MRSMRGVTLFAVMLLVAASAQAQTIMVKLPSRPVYHAGLVENGSEDVGSSFQHIALMVASVRSVRYTKKVLAVDGETVTRARIKYLAYEVSEETDTHQGELRRGKPKSSPAAGRSYIVEAQDGGARVRRVGGKARAEEIDAVIDHLGMSGDAPRFLLDKDAFVAAFAGSELHLGETIALTAPVRASAGPCTVASASARLDAVDAEVIEVWYEMTSACTADGQSVQLTRRGTLRLDRRAGWVLAIDDATTVSDTKNSQNGTISITRSGTYRYQEPWSWN